LIAPLTPNLSTYLLPTAADVPENAETLILENPEPIGPWGVRGLGEAPLLGIAPALVSAIRNATGVWFDSLPLTPPTVLEGLLGQGTLRQVVDCCGKEAVFC
jgi:CO/xanthine dehydrogenase Mo-binding subunit